MSLHIEKELERYSPNYSEGFLSRREEMREKLPHFPFKTSAWSFPTENVFVLLSK